MYDAAGAGAKTKRGSSEGKLDSFLAIASILWVKDRNIYERQEVREVKRSRETRKKEKLTSHTMRFGLRPQRPSTRTPFPLSQREVDPLRSSV